MAKLHSVTFRLELSEQEFLRYYAGQARDVVVRAEDGRRVRFPARLLRGFVTYSGIRGRFRLLYDDTGRSRGLLQLE